MPSPDDVRSLTTFVDAPVERALLGLVTRRRRRSRRMRHWRVRAPSSITRSSARSSMAGTPVSTSSWRAPATCRASAPSSRSARRRSERRSGPDTSPGSSGYAPPSVPAPWVLGCCCSVWRSRIPWSMTPAGATTWISSGWSALSGTVIDPAPVRSEARYHESELSPRAPSCRHGSVVRVEMARASRFPNDSTFARAMTAHAGATLASVSPNFRKSTASTPSDQRRPPLPSAGPL